MKGQVILDVGGEGAGLTLFGDKDHSGEWKFWIQTDETATFEALHDEDRQGLGEPIRTSRQVHSLPEGLKLLDQYPWFRLYPTKVHPEFREAILVEVGRRGTLTDQARWNHRLEWPTNHSVFEKTEDWAENPVPEQKDKSYRVGTMVELDDRTAWGPGKVLHIDEGNRLHIIFRDLMDPLPKIVPVKVPTQRVAVLQQDWMLELHGYPIAIALFGKLAGLPATTFQCPQDEAGRAKLAYQIEQAMRWVSYPWEGDRSSEKDVLRTLCPIMSNDEQATRALIALLKIPPTGPFRKGHVGLRE